MSRLQSRQWLFHSHWPGTACVIAGGSLRADNIRYGRRPIRWTFTVFGLISNMSGVQLRHRGTDKEHWSRCGGINLGEAIIRTMGGGRAVGKVPRAAYVARVKPPAVACMIALQHHSTRRLPRQ